MRTNKYRPPRMIQARHLTFNIEYGRYIKPLEDKLGKLDILGKGTNKEIGKKIYNLSRKYKFYTECDHDSFDAHVTTEMLKLTHTYYQSCYYHNKELKKLSNKTINNNCITRNGEKYRVRGTRMSGDVDTSLGNSIINYAILKEVVTNLVGKCEVIVNGDDSIIFSHQPIDSKLFAEALRTFNMQTKVKETVTNIHDVEFCRQKVVMNAKGEFVLMIDPSRLFEIYGMSYKQQSDYVEYLRQVNICNIAINIDNPLGKLWYDIYTAIYNNQVDFKEIEEFNTLELRIKLTAIKEIKDRTIKDMDTGELNVTTYNAWGNMDYFKTNTIKLVRKVKKLMTFNKINTYMIKYLPVSFTTYVDHNQRKLTMI